MHVSRSLRFFTTTIFENKFKLVHVWAAASFKSVRREPYVEHDLKAIPENFNIVAMICVAVEIRL
jgi:hypothetical protein